MGNFRGWTLIGYARAAALLRLKVFSKRRRFSVFCDGQSGRFVKMLSDLYADL